MPNAIDEMVEECRTGQSLRTVYRLKSGWVVLGETQVLPGYCLLRPDPVVPNLNELRAEARADFLKDMARVGDAILSITDAVRINYEILGNLEPALHAHIIPRYADEEEELATKPIWFYDWEEAPKFDVETDSDFIGQLRDSIQLILDMEGKAQTTA